MKFLGSHHGCIMIACCSRKVALHEWTMNGMRTHASWGGLKHCHSNKALFHANRIVEIQHATIREISVEVGSCNTGLTPRYTKGESVASPPPNSSQKIQKSQAATAVYPGMLGMLSQWLEPRL